MTDYVYLNGAIVPEEAAHVSVYNGGWLHGAGLFETIRAEKGRPLCLDRHLNRLCASAEKLLAPIKRDDLPNAETLTDLITRNNLSDARIRLTVTAGDMRAPVSDDAVAITIGATAAKLAPYPPSLYQSGMTVFIARCRQSASDPLVGHKTTCYLPRLLALRQAQSTGCGEALWFTTENLLAEGSISNVFIVRDGAVVTAPLDTPVLPGVARSLVLDLCTENNIPAREAPVTIDDLLDADEVFLTNVIMLALPVSAVESKTIADGKPGPVTRDMLRKLRDRVAYEN
jgi:branched-chain amino acid aminotransferase